MIKTSKDAPNGPVGDLCGVVLCGGKSRRFGSDKGRAVYSGMDLVTRAFHALEGVTKEVIIASGAQEPDYIPGVVHVKDRWKEAGPLAGIEAAFSSTDADALLVLAVDLPMVSLADLQELVETFSPPLTVASDGPTGRVQPLFAIWHRSLHEPLERYLESGGRAVMGFLDAHPFQKTDFEAGTLLNVNKSGDLPA